MTPGWSTSCLPLCLPRLHHPSAPTQQHRYHDGCAHPHLSTTQQLNNSTTPAYVPAKFTVSPNIVAVNILFFLSLALVLFDAFLAMLVKSWLYNYDCGWFYTMAGCRAWDREQRFQGLERWKMGDLVGLLPILIQPSLLFLCIGLIVLLFPIHLISAIFSLVALLAGVTFYLFTIYVSAFDFYAPFSSTSSRILKIFILYLQTTWLKLVQPIISDVLFHISHPSLPREHETNTDPAAQPLPGDNRVPHSLPQDNMCVKKQETTTPWNNDWIYADILERLVVTTAVAVKNIPVFLELLDQPVKDTMLWPSDVRPWKELLCTTLGLLGDPSTFGDSVACTIARSVAFCYDGESADQKLSRSLIHHFDDMCSGQTSKHKPLNSLFSPYLHYCCEIPPIDLWRVSNAIASLEPSKAADAELLWIINVIHRKPQWPHYQSGIHQELLEIFAAVLTYVSTTEQSRRSQVPLIAAIVYAMHTIKSALDNGGTDFIYTPYVIPVTVRTKRMFVNFCQVDTLDLWSDDCIQFASALLQPHTHAHWSGFDADNVWKFQLALLTALYIDSTTHATKAATTFAHLLTLTSIPEIKLTPWGWADTYDQTKLAGYWYTAVFQKPIHKDFENFHVQDIRYIMMQTIEHCSEMRLSALHLLDFSVKCLPLSQCYGIASAFLFLNVHTLDEGEFPAYQWFANSFISQKQTNQDFLHFLGIMLEHVKYRSTWGQLDSLDTWLAQLPEYLENEAAHVKLENVLATRKQEIEDEALGFFKELPMAE